MEHQQSAPSSVAIQTTPIQVPKKHKPFPHHILPGTLSFHRNIEELLTTIRNGHKVLILMRGVPGSGKSFLSKEILKHCLGESTNPNDHIFSADNFFYDARGRYNYDRNKIPMAHEDTQRRVNAKAVQGWSPLIIDNTNVKLWEMKPYVAFAVQNGYYVEVVQPMTPWSKKAGILAQKNSHGVPKDRIISMMDGFEHGTARDLICVS